MTRRLSKVIGSFIGGEIVTFIAMALLGMAAGLLMNIISLLVMHQPLLGLFWWASIFVTGNGAKLTFVLGIPVAIYDYFKHQVSGNSKH